MPKLSDKSTRPTSSSLNARGQEVPDPVPTEAPLQIGLPRSTIEMMRQVVRREMSFAAEAQGFETFEEADDFDIDDDPLDPLTPYEQLFEPPAEPLESLAPQGGSGGPPPAPSSSPGAEAPAKTLQGDPSGLPATAVDKA